MRILWFTPTSSKLNLNNSNYNGGGWISSLHSSIEGLSNINLGLCFYVDTPVVDFKFQDQKTIYYPLVNLKKKSFFSKIWRDLNSYKNLELKNYNKIDQVIKDFNPDLIHVFGTERDFGLISNYTKIPVIIHIQGISFPYLNSYFPVNTNVFDFFLYHSIKDIYKNLIRLKQFKSQVKRELKIFKSCKNYMGRTEWDKRVSRVLSKDSNYYHCDEVLRDEFYGKRKWKKNSSSDKFLILSTISNTNYKGFDIILKTAKILKTYFNINFEWNVIGISSYDFWEKKLAINSSDYNINLLGVKNVDEIISNMCESDIFVHPSYIDNSPNSVCEAQIIGLPVISTEVGGISSLIDHLVSGILVPINDPIILSSWIVELYSNDDLCNKLSLNSIQVASSRHDKIRIRENLMNIYKKLLYVASY